MSIGSMYGDLGFDKPSSNNLRNENQVAQFERVPFDKWEKEQDELIKSGQVSEALC